MELSLVLVSQGIESVIVPPAEEHGWQLAVDARNFERAVASIKAYRAENRRPWTQELPVTGMVFDYRSVVWFLLVIAFFVLEQTRLPILREAGLMHNQAVQSGEWWRLFTAILLHGDIPHLIANVTTGILLLGLAMGGLGPGWALLGSYLAGAGGNLAGYLVYGVDHRGLGASGMVMGALGLMAGQSVALLRSGVGPAQLILRGLLGGFLLLVLVGLDPNTDVIAHVGGFASGVVVGAILTLLNGKLASHNGWNRVAELLSGLMVAVTWWLALSRTQ